MMAYLKQTFSHTILCNWYLGRPYNNVLQYFGFDVTSAWTTTAAHFVVKYFLILDIKFLGDDKIMIYRW